MPVITTALTVAATLLAGTATPQPLGTGYQLACGQLAGGVVTAQSTQYRLHASLPYAASNDLPRSESNRLFSGCLAGFYNKELFDQLFADRLEDA
ncbi:MAG: hypothetical protein HND55_05940 [Pseudomonadota bacterium]|nr:MAG: hypothetical protein HND55_05940 [Pseudomonadota bacterium]